MKSKAEAQWFEVRVPVVPEIEEAVCNFLFELGSAGCQQFEYAVTGFFPAAMNAEDIQIKLLNYYAELRALGLCRIQPKMEIQPVENLDWAAIWKRHFKPIYIFEKLVIKPSWETAPATAAAVIEIEPKQAFGTGNHATTHMALEFLAQAVRRGDVVLDVGAGTGILAIAAVKLGAGRAVAVDIDPLAIAAARENVRQNRLAFKIDLVVGTTSAISADHVFDIIAANLNRREIAALVSEFHRLLKPGGGLFATGILVEEAQRLRNIFVEMGFSIQKEVLKEDWMGMILGKQL
jgi:ribosomal protein L11 methyltransferase